ncbi:MAG: FAD-dependent oxidoreductase [Lachnospiraceae bacterium]|nr:FAD-dependent oxidoreductase [Lachnospiraceae bacterium]
MTEQYDVVIIGSGPAGLAAAIYAQRAKLNTLVLEKEMMSGGQVLNTYEVDNYPGLPGINGFDLGTKLRQHADQLGARFVEDEVKQLTLVTEEPIAGIEEADELQAAELQSAREPDIRAQSTEIMEMPFVREQNTKEQVREPLWKHIRGKKAAYLAKTVIVATGATHRKLGVPGEKEFSGRGISYCATCDGAFFKKKTVVVVGGGDVALEDGIFLARMCRHVYLIHRRDELRGAKILQEKLFALDNVTVIWDSVVEEILGEEKVNAVSLRNKKTGESFCLDVDGVFIAVGITPNSQAFTGFLELDQGYICADENGDTGIPGVYAAGDVRRKQLRQIVTAVADGANAVTSAEHYLTQF